MPEECRDFLIEFIMMKYLLSLKIYPILKGYDYIVEGVKIIINDCGKKKNVVNVLYTEIARKYNTETSAVDSALHHSINICYKNNGIPIFEKKFKALINRIKPTPREFLCAIAIKVKQEISRY